MTRRRMKKEENKKPGERGRWRKRPEEEEVEKDK